MRAPGGFRIEGDVVTCVQCRRAWHIPVGMSELSDNAWRLLGEHRDLHSASTSASLSSRARRQPRLFARTRRLLAESQ